ncbi:MAG: FeoA family protein [Phycisphaerales bacterium JB039]
MSQSSETRVPLAQLSRGRHARVVCMRTLDPEDVALLRVLGLSEDTRVCMCRTAGSCVLDVGERGACRIALDRRLAERILVGPVEPALVSADAV